MGAHHLVAGLQEKFWRRFTRVIRTNPTPTCGVRGGTERPRIGAESSTCVPKTKRGIPK